jgi:hypothetical protein
MVVKMMQDSNFYSEKEQKLFEELCILCNEKNKINNLRSKARYKIDYWNKALNTLYAHNETYLKKKLKNKRDEKFILSRFKKIKDENSLPKAWKILGISGVRLNILKYKAQYAQCKHETAFFTLKNSKRIKEISKDLGLLIEYDNGYINLVLRQKNNSNRLLITKHQIKLCAEEHEFTKFLEKEVLSV